MNFCETENMEMIYVIHVYHYCFAICGTALNAAAFLQRAPAMCRI
jgi:hypothetical protein